MLREEEVGQLLQGPLRFLLRVRLQHGNRVDRSFGAFFARWRRLGLFAVAPLTRHSEKYETCCLIKFAEFSGEHQCWS